MITKPVTAWSGVPLRVGQKLFGNSIDALTEIKALDGTGTGGLGTYTVSKSQTNGSDTIKVGLAQKNFIRGSIRSTYGFDFLTNTYTIGDFSVDATLLDSVPHMLASRNLTIRTTGSLTAVRSIIWPEGGPVQRITNSTTGGWAIILKNKTGGSTVTIANGATVNVASTPCTGSGTIVTHARSPFTSDARSRGRAAPCGYNCGEVNLRVT